MRWHSLSRGMTEEQHVHSVRHLCLPRDLARRLRTAALGEELYDETFTVLVMRTWPKFLAENAVHAWWPLLAPLPRLLHAPRRAR
jgi:hypothetical protein